MTAPKPGTPEWARLVTASKVAPILGLSPWESPYSIWHRMKGLIPGADENEAMRRGNMLEDAILDWWLADNPANPDLGRQVWTPLQHWAGATPDMHTQTTGGTRELVDAKTAKDDDEWGAPGTDQVPAYYAASSMWQLACDPAAARVRLAVLFGRPFTLREYVIERDDEMCGLLVNQCRDFWETLAADAPPDLDGSVATYDAVRALHPDIDRELTVDLDRAVAAEYVTADVALKDAMARATAAKSRLLDAMGNARLAACDGVKVARRQPSSHGVSLYRTADHIAPPTDTESEPAA